MVSKKFFFIQWVIADWFTPDISACAPETRGILFDWICQMHLDNRCGQITGTREALARLGRCSTVQVENALADLKHTKAAEVTERNGIVTVINRRMKREYKARKHGAERVTRHRQKGECNAADTPHNHNHNQELDLPKVIEHQLSQGNPPPAPPPPRSGEKPDLTKLTLEKPMCERIAKALLANQTGCFYDNCKVDPEQINPTALKTVLLAHVGQITLAEAHENWNEAVERTHNAVNDGLVNSNIPGYCINTYRDLLKK